MARETCCSEHCAGSHHRTPSLNPRSCNATSGKKAQFPFQDCEDRQRVQLTGTVSTVTINPRGGHPALEVELRDGSGAVTLVWLGRRQIPGIDCGRTLKVWGRISCHEGKRLVYNPRYELMQTPAAS